MTIFCNDTYKTIEERIVQLEKYPEWVKYISYGVEHTECGKVHLQCFCITWNPARWSLFNSWIGSSYRAPMHGRLCDNEKYVAKEGNYKSLGEPPMQGRRTDIIGTKRRLDSIPIGVNVHDVAQEDAHFGTIIRNDRAMERYVANKRARTVQNDMTPPSVVYIYGDSGTGKSGYVRIIEKDLYKVPNPHKCWRGGYNLDEVVLYDNVESDRIDDRTEFLVQIDRYPHTVETKGGQTAWKPRRIYITSTQTPDEFAKAFRQANEFYRRVTYWQKSNDFLQWFIQKDTPDYLSPYDW